MATVASTNAKIASFIRDTELAHQIVHGTDTTVVATDGGPVDSLAKTMKELGEQSVSVSEDFLNGLEIAVTATADATLAAMDVRINDEADVVLAALNTSVNVAAEGILAGAVAARDTAIDILPHFTATPPVTPIAGQMWTDNATGRKYEWVVDVDSSQWVETGAVVSVGIATEVGATGAAQQALESSAAAAVSAAAALASEAEALASADEAAATLAGAVKTVDLAAPDGAGGVGHAAPGGVLTTAADIFNESVSVARFGALGTWDGATGSNDTLAFNIAISIAKVLGQAVLVPTPLKKYRIDTTLQISEYCPFIGDSAGLMSQYLGKQGGAARIHYTGAGACFQVNPNPTPGLTVRLAYGQLFRNLIIEGNATATHGIKVSDASNINVAGMDLAGLQIDNVFIYGFKAGRALEVNYCFNNSIKNLVTETCGVASTLNYAHNTTFIAGSLEQCLVGLDAINSYDVTLHGTCLQGMNISRIASQGLAMPADFFIWTGAWAGAGPQGVTRTLPLHYAGIGVRNFGSVVSWFGGYEEGNQIGYLTELGSSTGIYGKVVDLDAPVEYFAQFGIGAFTCENTTFKQGGHAGLIGVFHTERNYAAPINIRNPIFASTVPNAKKFTGIALSESVGTVETYDPAAFRSTETLYRKDLVISGGTVTHGGSIGASGFNREFRQTLGPTSVGVVALDLASGTTGTNITHVMNGATLTVSFSDALRAIAGTSMRITLINTTGPSTVTFSPSNFVTASSSYYFGANRQRVFHFFFENGAWLEEGFDLPL